MVTQYTPTDTDSKIKKHLTSLSSCNADYWSFRGKATREHTHGYFQYPAMMVPQLQRQLIKAVLKQNPRVKSVFDPFVGSGTILTESMLLGLDFSGVDINPLAILSCKTKKGLFCSKEITCRSDILINQIQIDKSSNIEVDFPGINKWFEDHVINELSTIKRNIRNEPRLWIRRFFWLTLSETVRLCSNSRTSTFKLHIRTEDDLESRNISAIELFVSILRKNIIKHRSIENILQKNNLIKNKRYIHNVDIVLSDSSKLPKARIPKYDLLITSPPYGDNGTTVPYGQYSYLPLQWIDLKDIDKNLSKSCLETTSQIDYQSLGGSKRIADQSKEFLFEASPSLRSFAKLLDNDDLIKKVLAFSRDLETSLTPILDAMKANSYLIWTLGNRSVGGETVPLDQILQDFLFRRNVVLIQKIERDIPSKRMALKNNVAKTMSIEIILVMRKCG